MTIRYLLYTDPSRRKTTQLGPDFESDDLPPNAYGQEIYVEGQPYHIANIGHIKLTPCSDEPGAFDGVYQVFLARPEQWPEFKWPEVMRQIRQQELNGRLN